MEANNLDGAKLMPVPMTPPAPPDNRVEKCLYCDRKDTKKEETGMSTALEYADETVRKMSPEDRLKLLQRMGRYCWNCGRVSLMCGYMAWRLRC